MKFKNILFTMFIGLCASCSDALDVAPDGNMTMDEIWADVNYTSGALNACYRQIPMKGYYYHFFDPGVVSLTDDGWSSEDGAGQQVAICYAGTASASYHVMRDWGDGHGGNMYAYWTRYWEQIRLCNQFLENIPTAAVSSESDRARYTAEARVLRAFFYTELIKWFGKVPIVDKTISMTEDFSEYRRASVYELAQFIGTDCDAAIACPDLPWRITESSEAMRATKALAYALKSQMMLFAASPLHNEGNNYWQEAYKWNKEAVDALKQNGYELFTTCTEQGLFGTGPEAAFHQLACRNADYSANPRDKETIFSYNGGGIFIWHIGYIGSGMDGAYKCGTCPSQELVDAFETKDGQPVLDLAKPYQDEYHLKPNYNNANSMYDPNNPYENRDPRFYATVLYHGAQFVWNNGEVFTVDVTQDGKNKLSLDASDRDHTRTGYYHKKMVPPTTSNTNQANDLRWKFYRLGEILLNFAEAAAEAGQLEEARAAANEVRARVQMPELPAGLSQAELILRIRNERRVELAWEENRYWDLRRWQQPTGDLSETCKYFAAMQITKNADGTLNYNRVSVRSNPRGGWENKDLLLPLPLAEASNMEAITGVKWQNPGW